MKNDDRTEKPTARRRKEAQREGSIAKSQDLGAFFGLVALLATIAVVLPLVGPSVADRFAATFAVSGRGHDAPGLGELVVGLVLRCVLPVLAIATVLGILGGLLQTRGRLATKAARPRWKNLSLKRGLAKFSPKQVGWELVRGLLKLSLLVLVAITPVMAILGSFDALRSLAEWLELARSLLSSIVVRAVLLTALVAVADYAWSHRRNEQSMKMSKQDVKDEFKMREGDPSIRGRRRAKMRELNRNRVIAAVGSADVVVVNPVRFAVALKYDADEPAPRVVTKGAGAMARRIRREAYRHGVPVRQDPPLARALFRRCQVGQFVPAALFEAVAVVLAAVYRRRWRRHGSTSASTAVPVPEGGRATRERSAVGAAR